MRAAPDFWQRRGFCAVLLLPLAALFGAVALARRFLYRRGWLKPVPIPVPVIIVGNIAVGGSGKTPAVLWLAAQLRLAGFRPGIISRGYGGSSRAATLVSSASDAYECGDEAVLLAQLAGCPVVTAADRPAAALYLLERHPECNVILSDDGMQHYRLRRDIEIAVVDEQVLGNRWLLPAGPLREGVARLGSVDMVLAHGPLSASLKERLAAVPVYEMTLRGAFFRLLSDPSQICGIEDLRGRRIHALAGIGRPERFFSQLEAMGLEVERHAFPDHHRFTPADFEFAPHETKIMTSKDAVKCRTFAPADSWEVPVAAHIDGGAAQWIVEKLNDGRPTA